MAALSLNQVFQVLGLQSCAFVTLNKGHHLFWGMSTWLFRFLIQVWPKYGRHLHRPSYNSQHQNHRVKGGNTTQLASTCLVRVKAHFQSLGPRSKVRHGGACSNSSAWSPWDPWSSPVSQRDLISI